MPGRKSKKEFIAKPRESQEIEAGLPGTRRESRRRGTGERREMMYLILRWQNRMERRPKGENNDRRRRCRRSAKTNGRGWRAKGE